jgi:hypothetical protein
MRRIDGVACMFIGHTRAGHRRFRTPTGECFTVYPRKRRRIRAPSLYARVRVWLEGRWYRGLVAKRSPLRFRITEPGEAVHGKTIDRTRYVLETNWL